jgi:hypothetical protein
MFRLAADAHLSAAFLFALWFVNRSARPDSRMVVRSAFGGGGRLGDCLIIQSFSGFG